MTKASKNDINDGLRCYECKKLEHTMVNCPLQKAKLDKFKRKKAMSAAWDEFGGSESEEDSKLEAMLCFMDFKENDNEGGENKIEIDNPSYNDLL